MLTNDGKADHRTKPRHRCEKMVFEMVKDIKVVFGKGPNSKSVQSDDGRAPMWRPKPKSLPSDYDRTLTKAHNVRNLKKKCGKTIPQLGTQQK